jgi:hypothetical protein
MPNGYEPRDRDPGDWTGSTGQGGWTPEQEREVAARKPLYDEIGKLRELARLLLDPSAASDRITELRRELDL